MRLLLCAPDAWDVLEVIAQIFEQNGDALHCCDHSKSRQWRTAGAQEFAPEVALFFLPLVPGDEIEEAQSLAAWGKRIVCLSTNRLRHADVARAMHANVVLDAPCDLTLLERAVYAAPESPA